MPRWSCWPLLPRPPPSRACCCLTWSRLPWWPLRCPSWAPTSPMAPSRRNSRTKSRPSSNRSVFLPDSLPFPQLFPCCVCVLLFVSFLQVVLPCLSSAAVSARPDPVSALVTVPLPRLHEAALLFVGDLCLVRPEVLLQ